MSLFKICKLNAIVPGPGEPLDIVLNRNDFSTIFECRNEPIRGKRLTRLKGQLKRYMARDIVNDTRNYLSEHWNFQMNAVDVFFVSASKNSKIESIIQGESDGIVFPMSFISTEAFFEMHKVLIKKQKLEKEKIMNLFSRKGEDISFQFMEVVHYNSNG
ncbi:MAG: hypothetical protein ACTSVI_11595 [Promethearchaeota archaeon]